jgi:riboflavin synthase
MFTGLIQETGKVLSLISKKGRTRITVSAAKLPAELKQGDSISVNGVCLTAIDPAAGRFSADLAEETVQRTSLGKLQPGAEVNLELAAHPQDRMGGHVVQGHVDGVGRLVSLEKIKGGEDWRLAIELPEGVAQYVVPQGSITVEGISLTVASIAGSRVEIAVIPHTYAATNLHGLKPGDVVNIEVDVLAKYAQKLLARKHQGRLKVEKLVGMGF